MSILPCSRAFMAEPSFLRFIIAHHCRKINRALSRKCGALYAFSVLHVYSPEQKATFIFLNPRNLCKKHRRNKLRLCIGMELIIRYSAPRESICSENPRHLRGRPKFGHRPCSSGRAHLHKAHNPCGNKCYVPASRHNPQT